MLPGFRFLFAAIVLSMSILIFGLGAAALLRAAHEQFASIPARRRAAGAGLRPAESSHPPPTLALLRVEPPVVEKAPESAPAAVPVTAPDIRGAVRAGSGRQSGRARETGGADAARADAGRSGQAGNPGHGGKRGDPGPCGRETEAPVANAEVKIAAIAATPEPAAATPAATPPEPAADIPSFEGNIATTLIATLGGPAVFIDRKDIDHGSEAGPQRRQEEGRRARPGNGGGLLQHGARASRVRQR